MTMVYCLQQLMHVVSNSLLVEPSAFLLRDLLHQFSALHVFHDKVQILYVVIGFEVIHDVRVIKFLEDLDFIF